MSEALEAGEVPPVAATQSLSPWGRMVAVFVRPAHAWGGLTERVQWWIPVLVMVIVACAGTTVLQHRALLPMLTESWDQQVQDGKLPAAQAEKMEQFMDGPTGLAVMVGQQVVIVVGWALIVALVIWFGVGFVLGTKFRYRHALEVAAWTGLINLPAVLIAYTEAWFMETFKGLHTGFGALLPTDSHSKLLLGLGVVLDSIGPLGIWYLAVGILGAAALSGAPRRSVAWVLSSLYVALVLVAAAFAAMFTPAA
jgi:hypothetical protein